MHPTILCSLDDWRPHSEAGITYEQFCNKMEDVIANTPPYLKDIFTRVYKEARKTYHDRPEN